jgi:XTP/dITP diphosphohydrolase
MKMEKSSEKSTPMDWLIASNNLHKIEEIKLFFRTNGLNVNVLGLKEAGIDIDVPETASTFEGNAWLKAIAIQSMWNGNILADDSGLCVEALNGSPGIHSARYAGEPTSHPNNIAKLLSELSNSTNRAAHFLTVLVGYYNGQPFEVKGYVYGKINRAPMGWDGFGYDPVFVPNDCSRTFAELSNEEKNMLSHRANAMQQLLQKIKSLG